MSRSHLMPVMEERRENGKGALMALLPYWPVIAFACTCLVGLGGVLVKLDNIQKAVENTDKQFVLVQQQLGNQNDRTNGIALAISEIRGVNNQQAADLTRLEKTVTEIQTTLKHNIQGQRWQPK